KTKYLQNIVIALILNLVKQYHWVTQDYYWYILFLDLYYYKSIIPEIFTKFSRGSPNTLDILYNEKNLLIF
ncbi:MAG: hypothetical protein KAJ28_09980, partial [Flavobacteriaceae bacterium]|nr:hypothetical protein [Flavobacteriaceae bacterium]